MSALALGLCALAGGDARADHAQPPSDPGLAKLQPLKKLVGSWQGTVQMGDKPTPVTITYETTAGGSAVVERLFPGTPHEMMSVYTTDGDSLAMTHYCAMGNHPKMTLKKADAHSLSFEMAASDGLRSPSELHMHAMNVSWTDGDHIREVWTSFDHGKPKDEKVFDLTRKK
jgi:hypothetical protein